MINALGEPQSLLLLGGTSDIALAIARRYARPGLPRPSSSTSAARSLKSILRLVIMHPTLRPSSRLSPAATSTSR
jgi:decaprenylphospho-beta-D-erythro-pentofuranosid-2-ulose 2-reductase